jgi:hypothetical protein
MQLRTKDLGLIASLATYKTAPIELIQEGKHVVAVYELTPEVESIQADFYNNVLGIDSAMELINNYKIAKNQIYKIAQPQWFDPSKVR